ncbi:hypothetical protein B9Z55_027062 [Caenorhabditis nigoni]|uniref:Uncharacterized protein n=1 Tax=Caenorhabditis nigoni TaxID=1611254 RepID=A0A2G5SJ69_9PELO|nr:hypothetical protein B9Z55_027062 [Caenorhabditis nigoni]
MRIKLGGPNDSCAKYTKKGNEFLKITHARILQEENHMIVGNLMCTPKTFDEAKLWYTLICDGVTAPSMQYYFLIAVTTRKQMLSGPIDYRYNEKVMGLVKNRFLDAENLKDQKFDHEQHLYIKEVVIDGHFKKFHIIEDCESAEMRGLIADHGLYAVVGNKKPKTTNYLLRMYYEPYGINEHLFWNI